MKIPKVSVIIPTYNAENFSRECLDSVLNQTCQDYEVVVVDNNSSDNTKAMIGELQKRDEKLRYVFEPKKGRGAARNSGVKSAIGEIIVMTDADCVPPPDWIEELIKPIVDEGEIAVIGTEEDLIKNYWTINTQKTDQAFLKRNLGDKYISHVDTKNFAIRSPIMKGLMFDSNLGSMEDFDFYLRLKKIARIRYNSKIIVEHNHKSSFFDTVKMNFDRAYWLVQIYEKHKNCMENRMEPMFGSISLKNFLSFPFWMILQFIKKPIGEAIFIFISELSWRAGILSGMIKKYRVISRRYGCPNSQI